MPDSPSRRSRKRQRTRTEILAAGARLLDRRNFSDLSIGALCEEADVARATFFLHFDNKSSLLLAWEAELVEALDDALAESVGRVASVYRAMADAFWLRPGVSRCVIGTALGDPSPGVLLERVRRELTELAGRGMLRPSYAPELAARVWLGEVAAVLGSPEGRRGSTAQRDELLRVVLSGVTESKPRLKWSPARAPGASQTV